MSAFVLILLGLPAFAWLGLFHLLLALGVPMGRMAWGGQYRVLPRQLRWGSFVSLGLAALGFVSLAQSAGLLAGLLPALVLRPVLGALCVLFAMSVLGNLMSKSWIERLHGVPLAALLAASCGVAAFG